MKHLHVLAPLCVSLLVAFACSDAATPINGVPVEDSGTAVDAGIAEVSVPKPDLFSPEAKALLAALGDSVWNGTAMRKGKARTVELRFRASSLQWAEIQNPFGPARKRELRSFVIENDGISVAATANTPLAWPDKTDEAGRKEYKVRVEPGAPRTLEVTRDGTTERYVEGAVPAPTSGLTARVRAFASGAIADAFCSSGANGMDHATFLSFARGKLGTPLAEDIVAGANLQGWLDLSGQNRFSVPDVDGFRRAGGTELSDSANFFVHYSGMIVHPGGAFAMRERDDVVEDGVWSFIGPQVGSILTTDLFLEVHGFPYPDKTVDAPSRIIPAGKVPIEVIVARCAKQIAPIHVEFSFGGGSFALLAGARNEPIINDTLFPPAL
jgi:hypothetical protein